MPVKFLYGCTAARTANANDARCESGDRWSRWQKDVLLEEQETMEDTVRNVLLLTSRNALRRTLEIEAAVK